MSQVAVARAVAQELTSEVARLRAERGDAAVQDALAAEATDFFVTHLGVGRDVAEREVRLYLRGATDALEALMTLVGEQRVTLRLGMVGDIAHDLGLTPP